MAFAYEPLHNMVIIKPKTETITKGGIYIPDAAQEKSCEGAIVAVGPGRIGPDGAIEKMSVKVGDYIVYPKFGNSAEIEVDGEVYSIIPEHQIIARKVIA